MSFQAVWERHRRFVMAVSGGLAMFLILSFFIQGCRAGAVATERDNRFVATETLKLLDELDLTYDREIKESRVLEKRRDDLS